VEHAADERLHPGARVAGWSDGAFAVLTSLPHVRRVGLALVEGGGRRLRFTASDRDRDPDVAWCHVDAYDDVPLNTAVRTGEPVFGALDQLAQRYAAFAAHQEGTPHVALAAVPLLAGEEVLGGYVLFYDRLQAFDDAQCRDLTRLGRELGDGLLRARLLAHRAPVTDGEAASSRPGVRTAVHEVAGERAAVGEARRFLRRTLAEWDVHGELVDTATLCLSELVTNAVIHAEGGCLVRIELHDDVLTVTVRDAGLSGRAAVSALADPLQVHGRGLQMVEALASRWGYDLDTHGAVVWFALDAP
jgi:anti-sigma regulatory factor (Ser/Thr protein kinase)